jgi:diguanylate cyclase (GGDEF)-like protein
MSLANSVKARVLLLVGVGAAVAGLGLFVFQRWQASTLRESAGAAFREQEFDFDQVHGLLGEPLEVFAKDYSRWDLAVQFVERDDDAFVDEQLAPGIETFGGTAAWVLRPDYSLVRAVDLSAAQNLSASPWPPSAYRALFADGQWFRHFHAAFPDGLLEVCTAPIQPDADLARRTSPRGYLVVARLLDDDLLAKLGRLTRTTLRRLGSADRIPPAVASADGTLRFVRALPGWDGAPAAYLVVSGVNQSALAASQGSNVQLALVACVILLSLGVALLGVHWWVTRPLARVRRSLDGDDPAPLEPLVADQGEFGAVARLLRRYFAQQEELRRRAQNDPLTGLPNRALLEDRLQTAIAGARRYARPAGVMMLDLDGFKAVNDSLGHEGGDVLLKSVATRLAALVRGSDTVARFGGDEFVVVLPEIAAPLDAEIVARRIVEAMAHSFFVRDRDVHIGVSVGLALYPQDGEDAATLLKAADEAMYRAKKRGKGRFALASEPASTAALERSAFVAELRVALDEGAVHVRYLPRIDLATGAPAGAEACVQWERTEGVVMPLDELQRLAEETGAIVPLQDFVLRTVCRDVARWRASGVQPGTISVRLCSRRLVRPANVDEVVRLIGADAGTASSFELRVPETVLLAYPDETAAALRRLKAAGVQLALDDYGLAAASLNHLRALPFDGLVVPAEFVAQLEPGSDHAALLAAVATLARGLGRLRIVAAGVADAARLVLVRTLGCHTAQGPAVSPPVDADGLAERLVVMRASKKPA